ncbi:hypothetical protein M0811_07827 [Anaeramoeba ignava]|uniref:Uncharacterized protein n=1 Tax=Anaeramoeba ignava TaxID=1746090 RepID=A0A9Q0RC53_ANAIG|nr:hypothetical protein M0811_07827 [Anaeramoeba ignava]
MGSPVATLQFWNSFWSFTMNADLDQELLMNLKSNLVEHYKAKITQKGTDGYSVICDNFEILFYFNFKSYLGWVAFTSRLISWMKEYKFELKIYNEAHTQTGPVITMIFERSDK